MQYSNLGFSHMCSTRASFITVEVSSSHMHCHASDVDHSHPLPEWIPADARICIVEHHSVCLIRFDCDNTPFEHWVHH